MIELKFGESSYRFVDKENLDLLKKILVPEEISEARQDTPSEFPIQIILYKNSESLGYLGVELGNTPTLHYRINDWVAVESGMSYRLGQFIGELKF